MPSVAGFIPLHRKNSWREKAGFLMTSREINHLQLGNPGTRRDESHLSWDDVNQIPALSRPRAPIRKGWGEGKGHPRAPWIALRSSRCPPGTLIGILFIHRPGDLGVGYEPVLLRALGDAPPLFWHSFAHCQMIIAIFLAILATAAICPIKPGSHALYGFSNSSPARLPISLAKSSITQFSEVWVSRSAAAPCCHTP